MLKQILLFAALFSVSFALKCKIQGSETFGETCQEESIRCASTFDSTGKPVFFQSVNDACITAQEFQEQPFYGRENTCGMLGHELLCWCEDKFSIFGCNSEDNMQKIYNEYMKHTTRRSYTTRKPYTTPKPIEVLKCKTKGHEKGGQICPPHSVACVADVTGGKRHLFSSIKEACLPEWDFKHGSFYKGRKDYCSYFGSKVHCWCNVHTFLGCNTEDRMKKLYKKFIKGH